MRYAILCIESDGLSLQERPIIEGMMYYTSINSLHYDWLEIIHVSDIDGNYHGLYKKELFITLAEWRDKQIDEILND